MINYNHSLNEIKNNTPKNYKINVPIFNHEIKTDSESTSSNIKNHTNYTDTMKSD